MTDPIQPRRSIITGAPEHRLIRGALGIRADVLHIERVDVARTDAWAVSIVDSGNGAAWTTVADTTLHILWEMDEANAGVTLDTRRFSLVPGDTISIPGGCRVDLSSGMLFVQIETTSRTLPEVIPPSHGTETFEGYNRKTAYEVSGTFTLHRWKITAPLTVHPSSMPLGLICLAEPLALTWSGGMDLIGRGECRVIEPETGPVTLLPDGLGYALLVT